MKLACARRPAPEQRSNHETHHHQQHLQQQQHCTSETNPYAFVVSAFPPSSTPLLSNIVIGATAAIAGLLLGQLSSIAPSSGTPGRTCETCRGSGYVECSYCNNWDFSSVDKSKQSAQRPRCTCCYGSQRIKCPNCRGGGGLTVPILSKTPIPVRIDDGYNSTTRRFETSSKHFHFSAKSVSVHNKMSRLHHPSR